MAYASAMAAVGSCSLINTGRVRADISGCANSDVPLVMSKLL